MKKKMAVYGMIVVFAVTSAVCGMLYTRREKMQAQISEKVLRFHVLANSDSEDDQRLKLKVRDAVGGYMQKQLADVDNLPECRNIVDENIGAIKTVAERVVEEEGYHYKVDVDLEETSFPVKSYGNYTFPAGVYEALRIVIGAGDGHNWWCVMYPNLCFSGSMYQEQTAEADGALREVLSEEEYETVFKEGNYRVESRYFSFLNPYLEKLTE